MSQKDKNTDTEQSRSIPEGWVETTLGEAMTFQRGFDLPTNDRKTGIFPLMVSNGQDGTHNEFKVKGPGIVTGRSGSLGNVFYVEKNFWPLNTTLWIKNFHKIDVKFSFYHLKTFPFQKYNSGSGVPSLNRNHIHPLPIIIPKSIQEQKAIANILTAFDDKIENLRAQNDTLEQTAQTLFEEWFGKYQIGSSTSSATNYELPEGWRVGKLGDIINIIGGGTPKTSKEEYWNGDILWYSVADAPKNNDFFVINTEKKITALGLLKSSTKMLRKGTTIISARGTVGKLAITGYEMTMNQSCYGIQGKDFFGDFFVYFQIKQVLNILKNNVHGAVFDTITKSTLEEVPIPIANKEDILNIEIILDPLMNKILYNVKQIQTLTQTRDTLLPKLMSGQLRVKNIETLEIAEK